MRIRNLRHLAAAAALAAVSLVATGALPQPTRAQRVPAEAYSTRTEIIFTDADSVTGGIPGPDGVRIRVAVRPERPSLITVRQHFVGEMLKAVENL